MRSSDVRKKFIAFYESRGHAVIPSASLVPESDPTTLFTSSGMQPLIGYLLGQPHPSGKRIVNSQRSFRAQDIEEVGDNRHGTFFEMLGNWSLGDYFKNEQLPWIFEFLTREIGLDPRRLYVTVFEGNASVPKDTESIDIWKEIFHGVGIDATVGSRIFAYPAKKNWWSRCGEPESMPAGEPGGPDSEVFYDFGPEHRFHERSLWKNEPCHPNCDCGRFMEIANSVFMQYQKQPDGTLKELVQKNVDFGGGLERLVAATEDTPDVFYTDLYIPILKVLEALTKTRYEDYPRQMRIIADHIKASVMMTADGVSPSNKAQGYVLRRLIRRVLLYWREIERAKDWQYTRELVAAVAGIYEDSYPEVTEKSQAVAAVLEEEAARFGKTLEKGIREIEKIAVLDGKQAFILYETYGFPWEMTVEIASTRGQTIDRGQFESEFDRHKALSRTATKGMFVGGLADNSEQTVKLHTAHHLLLAALQRSVDPAIKQRGSNITAERLRMDVNFSRKFTPEELGTAQTLVNEKIRENLAVMRMEMDRSEAQMIGAQMEFGQKYPDRVSVYFIGDPDAFFSAEFCGGPHVARTGSIGTFHIFKEESAGSGIRRIYARVE